MDLVKELQALDKLQLPREIKEQKMRELAEKFLSDEKNVDQIFGALADVAIKHDK